MNVNSFFLRLSLPFSPGPRAGLGGRLGSGLAGLILGSVASLAQAELVEWSAGHVNVAFDPESFQFSKDDHSFGGVSQVDISPLSVSYSPSGNGVLVDFQDQLSVYATSYTFFTPETLTGSFNAFFSITPQAGYAITGYTVNFSGIYSIETPGSVGVGSTIGGGFASSTGGGAFNFDVTTAGATPPSLQGSFNATGDISSVQVLDGYQQVFDHYDSVLDYCESEAPFTCYYRDEPVYISVPQYHDETDLGEATITLRSINVQAHVVAVPEPGAVAMVLGAMPALGWWAGRRRRLG